MMWSGWGWHWLWMLGFWAIFVAVVVWAVVRLAPTTTRESSARRILDERYARGELGDDDYRRLRTALER